MTVRMRLLLGLVVAAAVVEHILSDAPTRVHIARGLTFYPLMIAAPWLAWKGDLSRMTRLLLVLLLVGLVSLASLAASAWAIAKIEFTWFFYWTGFIGALVSVGIFAGVALIGERFWIILRPREVNTDSPDD